MELTAEHYRRAAIAYDAYCKQTGGKSLVTGDMLPPFDALRPSIKDAWAALAIALSLDADVAGLAGRRGLVVESAEVNALAKDLGQLAKRHGLRGCVLISFTDERVGVNSSGEPDRFGRAMEQLGDRILAAIDDGKFDPTL